MRGVSGRELVVDLMNSVEADELDVVEYDVVVEPDDV